MARRVNGILDKWLQWRVVRRWQAAARDADKMDIATLRGLRGSARQMRQILDRVLHVADSRLTLPMIGADAIQKPLHSDWAARPELWRGQLSPPGRSSVESKTAFGREVTVFHDCQVSELTVRQIRNTRESDLAPFGLRMDVFGFDGSFLSLVIELPFAAVDGLKRSHMIRLTAIIEMEKPLEAFARLNVLNGPNTEQIVRELPVGDGDSVVEFDLAFTQLNEKRVERMWIDLVFENPEMSQVILRDITLSRRPRAEF
ncbi:DUF6478 family protein [Aliiroseovarius sp. 2305UL8-7]|uniref:DUF6478 family protein n=1 Tax=Aliiroseovarius conchicola TaxID=3121637 RepID=UPI0035295879